MAADVLMGTDAHAAWIGRYAEGRGEEGAATGRRRGVAPAGARWGGAGRRRMEMAPAGARMEMCRRCSPEVTPSRDRGRWLARRLHALREAGPHPRRHEPPRRGAVARGRSRLRLRGPRHLRSLPGGRRRGAFAKHGVTSSADHLAPANRRRATAKRSGLAADRRLGAATRGCAGTSSSMSRPRANCIARWCARRPTRIRSRSIPWCGCTTSRCVSLTSPIRAAICIGLFRGARP